MPIEASVHYSVDGSSVPFELEAETLSEAITEILKYYNNDEASLTGSFQDFAVKREFMSGAYDRYVVISGHVMSMVDQVFIEHKPQEVEVWLHEELPE